MNTVIFVCFTKNYYNLQKFLFCQFCENRKYTSNRLIIFFDQLNVGTEHSISSDILGAKIWLPEHNQNTAVLNFIENGSSNKNHAQPHQLTGSFQIFRWSWFSNIVSYLETKMGG